MRKRCFPTGERRVVRQGQRRHPAQVHSNRDHGRRCIATMARMRSIIIIIQAPGDMIKYIYMYRYMRWCILYIVGKRVKARA